MTPTTTPAGETVLSPAVREAIRGVLAINRQIAALDPLAMDDAEYERLLCEKFDAVNAIEDESGIDFFDLLRAIDRPRSEHPIAAVVRELMAEGEEAGE